MDRLNINRDEIRKVIYNKIDTSMSLALEDDGQLEKAYYSLADRFVDNFTISMKKDKFNLEKVDVSANNYYDFSDKRIVDLSKTSLFKIYDEENSYVVPAEGEEAEIFSISDYVTVSVLSSLVNFSDVKNSYKRHFLESLLWGVILHYASDVFNELEIESILTDYYISYPIEMYFSSEFKGDISYLKGLTSLLDVPVDEVLKYGMSQQKFCILAYGWSKNEAIREKGFSLEIG